MTNTDNDIIDLDPTEDDLFAPADDDLFVEDDDEDESDDLDFDSNYGDDRYNGSGIPAWSAWA